MGKAGLRYYKKSFSRKSQIMNNQQKSKHESTALDKPVTVLRINHEVSTGSRAFPWTASRLLVNID
jgi:hypothetical protein